LRARGTARGAAVGPQVCIAILDKLLSSAQSADVAHAAAGAAGARVVCGATAATLPRIGAAVADARRRFIGGRLARTRESQSRSGAERDSECFETENRLKSRWATD
jgi:hypothetical protein